jgi:hypothetical protein
MNPTIHLETDYLIYYTNDTVYYKPQTPKKGVGTGKEIIIVKINGIPRPVYK